MPHAVALILAGVGVYGVMANSITERCHEIAIRMALGARAERLFLTVTVRALFYSAIGLIVGLVLAFSLARLLSRLIYGVSAWDDPTFLVVPASLFAIAFLACYWPARRATRMDP